MASRPEQIAYFERIASLERQKIHNVYEALAEVEDPYVTKILLRTGAAGMDHYQSILKFFECEPLKVGASDQRLNVRRSALGKVRIEFKSGEDLVGLDGYSVNLSARGMCVEAGQQIPVGTRMDIKVMLYGAQEASVVSGKAVWSKEVLSGTFMTGVAFGGG